MTRGAQARPADGAQSVPVAVDAKADAVVRRVLAQRGVEISINVADMLLAQVERGVVAGQADQAQLESELLRAIDSGVIETSGRNLLALATMVRERLDEGGYADDLEGSAKRNASQLEEFLERVESMPVTELDGPDSLTLTRDAVEYLLDEIDLFLGDEQACTLQPEFAAKLRLRKAVLETIGGGTELVVPEEAALDMADQALRMAETTHDRQPALSNELRRFALAAQWRFRTALTQAQGN